MSNWWNYGIYGSDEYDDGYDYYGKSWSYGGVSGTGTGYRKDSGTSGYSKYSRYRSSLGWSSGKLIDTTSSYFDWKSKGGSKVIKSSSVNEKAIELITKSYKAVRDFVVILDFPFDVNIQLTTYKPYCDSKTRRIFIPSKVMDMDDSKYNDQEKVNIFCGLGIHEAVHLKYTEYRVLQSFENKCKSYPNDMLGPKYNNYHYKFLMALINIIEDERIEDALLKSRPGYLEFIEREKQYKYSEFVENSKKVMTDTEQMRLINNLYRLIRFPQDIEVDVIEKYSEFYETIKNILVPMPASTKEACAAGVKVYKEVIKLFDDLKLNYDDTVNQNSMFSSFGLLGSYVFDEVKYGFDCDPGIDINTDEISKAFDSPITEKLVSGSACCGVNKKTYFEKAKGNRSVYQKSLDRVKKYIPSIRKLIKGTDKNYEFSIRGCRHGLLDTDKLAEAYQGVPQVYIRKGQVKTSKTTVCILIDESGSMCYRGRDKSGRAITTVGKDELARDAAILLNESLKNLPGVDLYIYGHTADQYSIGDTVLNIYKEGTAYDPQFALSNIQGRRENRDGTAIFEAAKRVRKFTDSNCIMFILSDGSPCASDYSGTPAQNDVKKNVEAVEKMGFNVIQVSIDSVHGVKNMFTNIVDLQGNVANLPKNLSQVIKKVIVADKTTTVS